MLDVASDPLVSEYYTTGFSLSGPNEHYMICIVLRLVVTVIYMKMSL